jgi:D-xylonolactonase
MLSDNAGLFLSPYDDAGETVPLLPVGPPELVVDHPSACGEGPLWNEDERAVYWVDIPNGRLFRYDLASGQNLEVYKHDGEIGGYTFQADGSILLFCSFGKIIRWNVGEVETIVESIPGELDGRFNDVIADPDGGVFCGTMPTKDHLARLYRLAPDGSLTTLFEDIGLSNGFGFSPDLTTFYHTDSNFHVIYQLDYEAGTGQVSNRRVLVRTPKDESVPDGMTVDAQGNIWSARWNGEALYKYTPDGSLVGKVVFPVRKVSSVAFGGEDLATAFVTTAGGTDRGEVEGPLAGSLFRVDLQVGGRAPFRSRVGV